MKHQRHSAIREVLSSGNIANQDDLRRKLAALGHHVTQATLSRDIRELRLSKGPTGYRLPTASNADGSAANDLPETFDVLKSFGLEVRQAQNLIVIITTTGGAQPIAANIDYEDWPEVVGTIAGDDTVLIICPDDKRAATLRGRIETYIG
jgi:transcriptional regulator of arginine metabolism